jgi:SAM-dependent methyltransferase
MKIKKYTEANRIAWNEAMPYHQKAKDGKFYRAFREPGYSCLDEIVTGKLKELGIVGKDIAQLGCNDGRETLSLKNLGAKRAVGFDISDAAIAEAVKLAKTAKLECEFVRTDIYEIPKEYNDSFDLIYLSIGFLPWLPDLSKFFKIAAGLLRKNGILLIYDTHPFIHMFNPDNKDEPFRMTDSYFRKEPWVNTTTLDYYNNTPYEASVHYDFPHTLSDVIGGLIKQQLEIILFEEHPHDISVCYAYMENIGLQLPLSYILAGKKK